MFAATSLVVAAACSSTGQGGTSTTANGWVATGADVVTMPVIRGGVTSVTALSSGKLETEVYDLTTGKRLWSEPATMAGRLQGLGVEPPAVVAGASGETVVADLEPAGRGRVLVARDARSGKRLWSRPETSTFGPAACGSDICVSEDTAASGATFSALDAGTGKVMWRTPGISEVEWSDSADVVVFHLGAAPAVEARAVATGRTVWSFPVERAVGPDIDLSGGWAFGALDGVLVGYVAPYQARANGALSSFGLFGLRLNDGTAVWSRRDLLRVYPGASPAVALITRVVTRSGAYGGFDQINPGTGKTVAALPAADVPKSDWWLAFPPDLSAVGFLDPGHKGEDFMLDGARRVAETAWSFCDTAPSPLKVTGLPGYYPVAAMCQYNPTTGAKIATSAPPPGWYTGAFDGWRVWRDQQGDLHAAHDAHGTTPGMYGS